MTTPNIYGSTLTIELATIDKMQERQIIHVLYNKYILKYIVNTSFNLSDLLRKNINLVKITS